MGPRYKVFVRNLGNVENVDRSADGEHNPEHVVVQELEARCVEIAQQQINKLSLLNQGIPFNQGSTTASYSTSAAIRKHFGTPEFNHDEVFVAPPKREVSPDCDLRKIARKIARNKHVFANGSPERSSEDHQSEENNSSNKVVPKST